MNGYKVLTLSGDWARRKVWGGGRILSVCGDWARRKVWGGGRFLTMIVFAGVLAGAIGGCRSTKKIQKVIATPAPHVDTTGAAKRAIEPVRDLHADSMAV